MCLWLIDCLQGLQKIQCGKEQCFQQMVLQQVDRHMKKNEARPLPCTICKKLLNMVPI